MAVSLDAENEKYSNFLRDLQESGLPGIETLTAPDDDSIHPMSRMRKTVFENLVAVLDRPENQHIQSPEQLYELAGLDRAAIAMLLSDPRTAYSAKARSHGDMHAEKTLAFLGMALQCPEFEIVPPGLWEEALSLADWQETVRLSEQSGTPEERATATIALYSRRFEEFAFTALAARFLIENKMFYLGDLATRTENQLRHMRHFYTSLLPEFERILLENGVQLGTSVPGWPPENLPQPVAPVGTESSTTTETVTADPPAPESGDTLPEPAAEPIIAPEPADAGSSTGPLKTRVYIRSRGFKSIKELVKDLDTQVENAGLHDSYKMSRFTIENRINQNGMLPFGNTGIFEALSNRRITALVNKKGAEFSPPLPALTTEILFDTRKRVPANEYEALAIQVHERFLDIMERPHNLGYLTIEKLAKAVGSNSSKLTMLLRNIHETYTNDPFGTPVANPDLVKLAAFIECEPEDIVPVDIRDRAVEYVWKRGIELATQAEKPRAAAKPMVSSRTRTNKRRIPAEPRVQAQKGETSTRQHMLDSGIPDIDTLTLLMNAHPAVAAKAGQFDLDRSQVSRLIGRPDIAFGINGAALTIHHYRALQAVNAERQKKGMKDLLPREFYGGEVTNDPMLLISKEISENLLKVLDRPGNRHIQSMKQLHDVTGYKDPTIFHILYEPWDAYRFKNGTLVVKKGLATLAKTFGCEATDLISHELWERAKEVHAALPAAAATTPAAPEQPKLKAKQPRTKKNERKAVKTPSAAPARSRANTSTPLREYMRESGILNDSMLHRLMNSDQDVRAKGGAFDLTLDQVATAVKQASQAYGNGGALLTIRHHRIVQKLNEVREPKGLRLLNDEDVYGAPPTIPAKNSMLAFAKEINVNLLKILDRKGNRHIQSMDQLHAAIGLKSTAIITLITNPWRAYIAGSDGNATRPGNTLRLLGDALGCETTDIVSHELWKKAQALRDGLEIPDDQPEAGAKTPDAPAEPAMPAINPIYFRRLSDLPFSKRSHDRFKYDDIVYLGDLVQKTLAEIKAPWPNFSTVSQNEVIAYVEDVGEQFGTEIPGWRPENVEEIANAYESGQTPPAPVPPANTTAPAGIVAAASPVIASGAPPVIPPETPQNDYDKIMGRILFRCALEDEEEDIARLLNNRLRGAGFGPEFNVTAITVADFIRNGQLAFGFDNLFEGLTYRRITEIVNEESDSTLPKLTTETLFEITAAEPADEYQILQLAVHDRLLNVLGQGRANRGILDEGMLAHKVGEDILVMLQNLRAVEKAYEIDQNAEEKIQAAAWLERMSRELECAPGDIVSVDVWKRAVELKTVTAPDLEKEKDMDTHGTTPAGDTPARKLPTSGAEVLELIRASGFDDPIKDFMAALNKPVDDDADLDKKYCMREAGVQGTIDARRDAFGRTNMYEGPTYRRFTETVNERRATLSLPLFTSETLFGVKKRAPRNKREEFSVTAHERFLKILERPENRWLLGPVRIGWKVREELGGRKGLKPPELSSLIRNVPLHYHNNLQDPDENLVPNPQLAALAKVLHCNVSDFTTPDEWRGAMSAWSVQRSGPETQPEQPQPAAPTPTPTPTPAPAPAAAAPQPTATAPSTAAPRTYSATASPTASPPIEDTFSLAVLEVVRTLDQLEQRERRVYGAIVLMARNNNLSEPGEDDLSRLRVTPEQFRAAMQSLTGVPCIHGLEPIDQAKANEAIFAIVNERRTKMNDDDTVLLDNMEGLGGLEKITDKAKLREELPYLERWTDARIETERLKALQPYKQKLADGFQLKVA